MKREQQDNHWNDLSEEDKAHYREQYAEQKTMSESGVPALLEDLFGTHNLNPKPMTYGDVANTLFEDKKGWIIDGNDIIKEFNFANCGLPLPFNATSKKQLEKLGAINKLLNVAKYLNGDWKPDWNKVEPKWHLSIKEGVITTFHLFYDNSSIVYFRTEELARQAVQILGEETIRLALSTDY